MNRRISHLVAGWRTGLSGPVLILQAGNALNYFGYGLVVPFEIIYLHQIRGFSTSTAGLVLATIMLTAAIVTLPTGALTDSYSPKAIVVAGSLAQTLGYAGFAFVESPWLAFACALVAGAGNGSPILASLAGVDNRADNQQILFDVVEDSQRRHRPVTLVDVLGNRTSEREANPRHPLHRSYHGSSGFRCALSDSDEIRACLLGLAEL